MVILPFYLERNVLCQLIHSVQLTQKNNHIEKMWLFFCLNAFMGAGDWIPPVPAFLFQRNHPHGGKALPRNRTAKNTAPLAYAIRLRGRVPADAALTKMDGKMADFFGEKDS